MSLSSAFIFLPASAALSDKDCKKSQIASKRSFRNVLAIATVGATDGRHMAPKSKEMVFDKMFIKACIANPH
uniref:Secreted protein n=1 Tax=Panagrellus redivivus TaxID=6233 RepID=A0A7E4VCN7_PANRE